MRFNTKLFSNIRNECPNIKLDIDIKNMQIQVKFTIKIYFLSL